MPLLSMFYGIILRMYNNGEHNPPHFHAYYSEFKAVFNLDGEIVEGQFPRKQTKLVQAWAEIHIDELRANWELAINEEPIFRIDPLK